MRFIEVHILEEISINNEINSESDCELQYIHISRSRYPKVVMLGYHHKEYLLR
jgi:hypothetical protein